MPRRNYKVKPKFAKQVFDISCNKQSFRSQTEARQAADDRMLADYSLELDVYRCPSCQNWHLTNRAKNRKD